MLAVFFVVMVALLVWRFGAIDVAFESSESNWADQEVLFKGRDFEGILGLFEKYKASCGLPNATLYRTTEPTWYNVFGWWSYWHDAKWKVPYQAPRMTGYFEPACARK